MTLSPAARRFSLTAHVVISVGWLGTVSGFLVLALIGLTSTDEQRVTACALAAESVTWWTIVPLAFASLLTGLVMSLGTPWGLFRHYWVLTKLLINLLASLLLLLHTQPIGVLAALARSASISSAQAHRLQIQLVVDAGLALLALLVATTLAVYKPRGVTPYGWRKMEEQRTPS